MIPCFLINLEHAVERREYMLSQLQARGINAEIIPAVNGRKMSEEERQSHINSIKLKQVGWTLSPAEIGCALSHFAFYRIMVERNIPYALVLEDDVDLASDFADLFTAQAMEQWQKEMPASEPYVIQLNYVRRAYRSGGHQITDTPYKSVKSYKAGWSTAAYIITLAAAKNMLKECYPLWATSDDWTYREEQGWLQMYAITPNVAWESALAADSVIEQGRSRNPHPKRKGVLGLIKRLYTELIVKPLFLRVLPRQDAKNH